VQALTFLPLVGMALLGRVPVVLVFVIAAIYWGSGLGTGPTWNTWIGIIIPAELRARFFGRRNRVCQIALLAGLLVGGGLLQAGRELGRPVAAFAVIFLIAAVARLVSVTFLAMQSEPHPLPNRFRSVGPLELVRRLRGGSDARLLLYLLAITFTSQFAAPFFTPYMLGELRFSYLEYTALSGTLFAAKILMFPVLGNFAHRFGAPRLLWLGGVGVIPLSALWLVSDSLGYLLGLQLLSGCAWAAYELATFLLIFDNIRESERTSVLTLHNLANAVMTVAGSTLGGMLLATLGQNHLAYATVFAVSAVARAATLLLLIRVAPVSLRALPAIIRALHVRPSAGFVDTPVVPSMMSRLVNAQRWAGPGRQDGRPERSGRPGVTRSKRRRMLARRR